MTDLIKQLAYAQMHQSKEPDDTPLDAALRECVAALVATECAIMETHTFIGCRCYRCAPLSALERALEGKE